MVFTPSHPAIRPEYARDPTLSSEEKHLLNEVLFDFARSPLGVREFAAVDDRVMGGSSSSRLLALDGCAAFAGELVLGGGGFASVRAEAHGRWSLAETRGVRIRCRGDGRVYKAVVRMDERPGVSYQCDFWPPATGELVDVDIEWVRCVPSWRGRIVPDAEKLAGERIASFGLMASKFDHHGVPVPTVRGGAFQLDVIMVSALRPSA